MANADLLEIKSKFEGSWILDKSENFEEFLKEMGSQLQSGGSDKKPTCDIKVENGHVIIVTNTGTMNRTDSFQLGQVYEADFRGEKMQIIMTYEGGKLVAVPVDNSKKIPKSVREVVGGELIITMTVGNVVCKRTFKRT